MTRPLWQLLMLLSESDASIELSCAECFALLDYDADQLVAAKDSDLDHVIFVLGDRYKPLDFYLNHCTGKCAYQTLARVFGDQLKPCPAGTVIYFDD